ncbi:MAG: sterol desaturase family protein [Rhodothalassiaceae bacterium]
MSETLFAQEPWIRLIVFAGAFACLALLEGLHPRRVRRQTRLSRWPVNGAMVVLGSVAIRLMGPIVAVEMALVADAAGWGLFNSLSWPVWLELALAVILLDLVIYAQHVLFHHVPMLWRVHQMHHADLDLDVTSGIRFHPIEFALSMAIKALAVLGLGASAAAVILFEIILNAMAMFNHANLAVPAWLDRTLRLILVTPDMHIVHHSVRREETDSNFGFNLSVWDRLFGTYRARPVLGPVNVLIGLPERQAPERLTLRAMLWMPFENAPRGDRIRS